MFVLLLLLQSIFPIELSAELPNSAANCVLFEQSNSRLLLWQKDDGKLLQISLSTAKINAISLGKNSANFIESLTVSKTGQLYVYFSFSNSISVYNNFLDFAGEIKLSSESDAPSMMAVSANNTLWLLSAEEKKLSLYQPQTQQRLRVINSSTAYRLNLVAPSRLNQSADFIQLFDGNTIHIFSAVGEFLYTKPTKEALLRLFTYKNATYRLTKNGVLYRNDEKIAEHLIDVLHTRNAIYVLTETKRLERLP